MERDLKMKTAQMIQETKKNLIMNKFTKRKKHKMEEIKK